MHNEKNELTKIVIVGAGGFGKEVLWTLNDCNEKSKKYEILGFIDDNTSDEIIQKFTALNISDQLRNNADRGILVTTDGIEIYDRI